MTMIRKTNLGSLGLKVGAQGLGCLNLTGFYGKAFDRSAALLAVDKALDLGVTLFDTADSYGRGTEFGFGGNESFLGEAIRARRANVVLATKFGYLPPADGSDSFKSMANMSVNSSTVSGDPVYVKAACEASLKRLHVDYIDLYFCHRFDPAVPIDETVGAMAELVKAGKVRFLGVSSVTSSILKQAASIHPITAVESEWSLWTRDIEYEVLPVARQLGIGIMAYAPLGRGILTGQLRSLDDLAPDDYRRSSPRFQGTNFERNLKLVEHINELARKKNCTPPQLALAWLHAQGEDIIPIPGAERPQYVSDNVGALEVQFDAAELSAIDSIFPLGVAAGDRYADMSQASDAIILP